MTLERYMQLDLRIIKLKAQYWLLEAFFPWKALWTRRRFNRLIRELNKMKRIETRNQDQPLLKRNVGPLVLTPINNQFIKTKYDGDKTILQCDKCSNREYEWYNNQSGDLCQEINCNGRMIRILK